MPVRSCKNLDSQLQNLVSQLQDVDLKLQTPDSKPQNVDSELREVDSKLQNHAKTAGRDRESEKARRGQSQTAHVPPLSVMSEKRKPTERAAHG